MKTSHTHKKKNRSEESVLPNIKKGRQSSRTHTWHLPTYTQINDHAGQNRAKQSKRSVGKITIVPGWSLKIFFLKILNSPSVSYKCIGKGKRLVKWMLSAL